MADPQWWTPEFAQQTDADAKAAALSAMFAQAAEQGRVTPSHQMPFASGAAEPVYPVESAIGGAAAGGLSRTAINTLFEMAAKNARNAEIARLEQSVGHNPQGIMDRLTLQGSQHLGRLSKRRTDPDAYYGHVWEHPVHTPITTMDRLITNRYSPPGTDRLAPGELGPINRLAQGVGRGLKDPRLPHHAQVERALRELLREGKARYNKDGTWELAP